MQYHRSKIQNNLINILFAKELSYNLVKKLNSKFNKEDIILVFTNSKIDKVLIDNYNDIKSNKYFILHKKHLKDAFILRNNPNFYYETAWVEKQHIFASFTFSNSSQATVMQGGVIPEMRKWEDIEHNVQIPFVNKFWPDKYDGRFGYIISSATPKVRDDLILHRYSCDVNLTSKNEPLVLEFGNFGINHILYL